MMFPQILKEKGKLIFDLLKSGLNHLKIRSAIVFPVNQREKMVTQIFRLDPRENTGYFFASPWKTSRYWSVTRSQEYFSVRP